MRRPPGPSRTDQPFPFTTLLRSGPGAPRRLAVQLVYPAGAAAVGGSRVSERAAILHALEGGPWPDEEARILADTYGVIAANSAQGAPAAATAGRLPLLLFSPGGYPSRPT